MAKMVVYELDLTPYTFSLGEGDKGRETPCAEFLAMAVTDSRLQLTMEGLLAREPLFNTLLNAARTKQYKVVLSPEQMDFIKELCKRPIGWDGGLLQLAKRIQECQPVEVEIKEVPREEGA